MPFPAGDVHAKSNEYAYGSDRDKIRRKETHFSAIQSTDAGTILFLPSQRLSLKLFRTIFKTRSRRILNSWVSPISLDIRGRFYYKMPF